MSDPKRLADGGGSPALAELLRAAEHDVLDDRATARVRAEVGAAIAGGGAAALGAKSGGIKAATFGAWKLALIATLGIVAATAAWLATRRPDVPPPPPARAVPAPSAASTVEIVAPSPVETTSSAAPSTAVPEPAKTTRTPAPRASASSFAPRAEASADAVADASPREGLLLLQARRALDGDPRRALELVRQHEREFPSSQLAPERATIRRQAESALAK